MSQLNLVAPEKAMEWTVATALKRAVATALKTGRGDGDVCPLQEPSPARAAEGAAREGVAPRPPRRLRRGRLAACEEGPRRKETTNLLVLERERVWVGISAPSPPSHESSSLDVTLYIFM